MVNPNPSEVFPRVKLRKQKIPDLPENSRNVAEIVQILKRCTCECLKAVADPGGGAKKAFAPPSGKARGKTMFLPPPQSPQTYALTGFS